MTIECRNYSIEELSWLLTKRQNFWNLLFVNSARWLWNKSCKQIMSAITVTSSLNLKNRAATKSAKCVTRNIANTSCFVNVAICWPAKIVDVTNCKPSNLLLSRKRFHQIKHFSNKAFCTWFLHDIETWKNATNDYTAGEFGNDDECLNRNFWTSRIMSYCNVIEQNRRFFFSIFSS